MKVKPTAVIVNKPVYEHGDIVEIQRPIVGGVVGEVGVVARTQGDDFLAYFVASRKWVMLRHDNPAVSFVGHVTKTSFAPAKR